jgi:hypothetical protein
MHLLPAIELAQAKSKLARDQLLSMLLGSMSAGELGLASPLSSSRPRGEDTLSGQRTALQKSFRRATLKNNFFPLVSGRNLPPAIEK